MESRQKERRAATGTHVLVRSDQEAVVDVSLHQTGFTHALLSQHHYFGIHPHHGHWVCEQKPGQDHCREQVGVGGWEDGGGGGGGALV